ncbi:MAG: DNA polymerase III [Patescibacteria group bacterium]
MKISKNMTNLEIAELLRAVAAAYQLKDQDKNKFRIVAYQRAADAVEHASSELKDLWDDNKLKEVPGIGPNIAKHLDEIFRTGKSKHFKQVMSGLSPAIFEMMKVSGIGAKTAYKLSKQLGIKKGKGAIKKLEKAVKKGKVSGIEGFGEQSQVAIEKSIKETKGKKRRLLLPYAMGIADEIIEWMKKEKSVKKIDPLGSLRRKDSTIGDVDIAVATNKPLKVLDHFTKYPKKQRVLEKGDKTASIIVPGSVQVDLMVQPPEAYGALLQHFTGSKHHNIALREHALKKQMSLSEYGIKQKGKLIKFSSEEAFYKKLGMDWIEPELREDTGEIEAALNHKLPKLVELKDIKGDLQIHSDFDIETSHDLGESSMEDIVAKANELGYEYIAFTEHNPSQSGHNEKQIIDILKRKKEKVEKLNSSLSKKRSGSVKKVFNSLEIDILPDGELPVPDEGLKLLDFALVSIHSSFKQKRNIATKRVLSALAHPGVKIFAHPTGRKLGFREGVELDWPQIFEFCKKHDKWLEINAEPMRLDLPDVLVHDAIKTGVKLTMGTDAHHKDGLNNMAFGISVARRGWATKADIVNTRSLSEFVKMLK